MPIIEVKYVWPDILEAEDDLWRNPETSRLTALPFFATAAISAHQKQILFFKVTTVIDSDLHFALSRD